MALSYSLRLACLFIVSLGLLHTLFELLLWLIAPALIRLMPPMPLRHQERALYTIQLLPFVLALAYTSFCWIPQYVSNETNYTPEAVGWLCLLLTAAFTTRWAATVLSATRMLIRTTLFSRATLHNSLLTGRLPNGLPIVAVSGAMPRVALVGLLRPFILISTCLTDRGGLDPLALDLVLEHERSHAAHLDNWKLFSLHCMPHLPLRVSHGKTWMQLWQSTAERAADHDAVRGSTTRALRLAETLVSLARSRSATSPQLLNTSFICAETELASRVEGLTQLLPPANTRPHPAVAIAIALLILAATVALATLAPILADLPEHLLHLG